MSSSTLLCVSGEQQNIFFAKTEPAYCSQSSVICNITITTKRSRTLKAAYWQGTQPHILATFSVFSLRIYKEIDVTKANVVHKLETGITAASIL
jgi:hypothetical protein